MSYDEWEAMRLVKCVAALKLMRRQACCAFTAQTGLRYCIRQNLSYGQ